MNALRSNPRLLAPVLGCLAMLPPLAIDTFFPAFHAMEAEFGVEPVAMQQSLSLYLAAYAGMSLLHGPLSDAYGRRGVIVVALLLFFCATLGCALAPSLPVLLTFRVLQGIAGGAGSIVGRAIIRDRFEGADATRLMSQVTLVFAVAPAVAPIVGGWVLSVGSWRLIFWLLAGFTLVLVAAALVALPETHPRARRVPFSSRQLFQGYRAILGDGRYLMLGTVLALNFASIFLYIASAPVFVLDVLHLDSRQFGWLFVPTIGGLMIGARTSAQLAGRALPSRIVQLGFLALLSGSGLGLLVARWHAPAVPWSVLPVGLAAIGVSLAQPTLTLAMLDRFPQLRGGAASLQVALSLAFNSLVSGVLSPLVSHDPRALALSACVLSGGGFAVWQLYRRLPPSPALQESAAS